MLKDKDLSHVTGGTSPDLLRLTIPQALEAATRKWGDQEAVVSAHQNIRWTYAELAEKAEDLRVTGSGYGPLIWRSGHSRSSRPRKLVSCSST